MYLSNIPSLIDLLKSFLPQKKNRIIQELFSKNNDFILLSKSSWSLSIFCSAVFIKKKKKINLFLPSYYCNYSLRFINLDEVNLNFYEVDSDENLNLEYLKKIKKNIDILISVNFFGNKKTDEKIYDFCKINSIYLIEDSTHCILPPTNREYGDIILYSPYKFLGTLSGAILIINSKGPNNINNEFLSVVLKNKKTLPNFFDHLKLFFLWLPKKIIQNVIKVKNKIKSFEDDEPLIFQDKENIFLSYYEKKFFFTQLQNIFKILDIRRKSYLVWYNLFNKNFKIKKNKILLNKKLHPYLFCLEDTNEKIINCYNFLKKYNLPVSTWPDLPKNIKFQKNSANKYRSSRLFLPLHSLENLKFIDLINKKYSQSLNNLDRSEELFFDEINSQRYSSILNTLENVNILQSVEHAISKKMVNFLFQTKHYVIRNKANKIMGAFQIVFLNFFIFKIGTLNSGPILNSKFLNQKILIILKISNFLKSKKNYATFFNPDLTLDDLEYCKYYQILRFLKKRSWCTSLIDLQQDIEKIKSNFSSKIRNSLKKKFYNKDITVIKSRNIKDIIIFLDLVSLQEKTKGYKGIGKKYVLNLYKQKVVEFFLVKKNNEIISGIAIAVIHDTATYLLGYFKKAYSKENLGYKLLFQAIHECKSQKIKYFDMGGVDYFQNFKVAKFKNDFGGKEKFFVGKSLYYFFS